MTWKSCGCRLCKTYNHGQSSDAKTFFAALAKQWLVRRRHSLTLSRRLHSAYTQPGPTLPRRLPALSPVSRAGRPRAAHAQQARE